MLLTEKESKLSAPTQQQGSDAEAAAIPPMPANSAVVLSDVHIGNGAPTDWYQASVHEPYLLAALDWVVQNHNAVRELILLGDLLDLWTYPPSMRPPSVAEIIAANPNVLGPGGALARAIAAVPKTTLLLGNHDGTLTAADIATLQKSVGPIALGEPVHVLTGSRGAKTVVSHGHYWTMFNAPDDTSPWNTLPVGHFVTRAFAYKMSKLLKPGQTVADLPNMGAPDGFELLPFVKSLGPSFDIAERLLAYVASAANMPESTPIVLPDGSTTTISDAKRIYANLFTRWVAKEHGSVLNAGRAALADASGEYLTWFAQRLAIENGADLVVMGHTHTPVSGLTVSPINYVNSGFECASIPDTPPKEFTFTVIDVDAAAAEILQVTKARAGYEISESPAPPQSSVVVPPAIDFSCYIRIFNQTSQPMTRVTFNSSEGYWVVPPPPTIAPGGRADAWLQDNPGPLGSEGSVTYSNGHGNLVFSVGCPTGIWPNTASGPGNNFIARSGAGDWGPRGQVPRGGHPLQVQFTVAASTEADQAQSPPAQAPQSAAAQAQGATVIARSADADAGAVVGGGPAADWTPSTPLAAAVYAAGFSYDPAQDIIYSRMDALQRQFGYAYGYDAAALAMSAVIDCEPIFFDYGGKHWMIELWKGQYGLETGCEIGVYTRTIGSSSLGYRLLDATVGKRDGDGVPSHNLFYDCASDADLLEMSLTLHRNGQALFSRGPQKHWWLTGFKWGVMSEPRELSVDLSITLKDDAMRDAFLAAIAGRPYPNLAVHGDTVSFTFETPFSPQPPANPTLVKQVIADNTAIVAAYDAFKFPNNDPNKVQASFLRVAGLGILRLADLYGRVVSELAVAAGEGAQAIVKALTEAFGVTSTGVEEWLSGAIAGFAAWVSDFERAFGLPLDFSCWVEIDNREGTSDLLLQTQSASQGSYAVPPPRWVPRGEIGRFVLQDPKPSIHGSEGSVEYLYCDAALATKTVVFKYECPTGFLDNKASASQPGWNLFAKSGNAQQNWQRSVPPGGHPLYVAFVAGSGQPG